MTRALAQQNPHRTGVKGGATFTTNKGFRALFVLSDRTIVLANCMPTRDLPAWIEHHPGNGPKAKERHRALLDDLLANPQPHLVAEGARVALQPADLFESTGACIAICRPGELVSIRPKQVARAREALAMLGTKKRARDLRATLARRERDGPSEATNSAVREIAAAANLTLPQLFDAVEALTAVTSLERQLAQT